MRLPSRLRTSRSRRAGSGSHDGAPRTSCASPSRARIPVARLGGHITNNGAPGWQVLGTRPRPRVLLLMELGWRAAQTSPPGDVIDDEHRSHRGGSRKRDHRPGTILARRDPLGSAYLYLAAGGSLLVGGIPSLARLVRSPWTDDVVLALQRRFSRWRGGARLLPDIPFSIHFAQHSGGGHSDRVPHVSFLSAG